MRLFRKNKASAAAVAAREPAITVVSVCSQESAVLKHSSSPLLAQAPLPALQLDLDLPALTQSTLGFSSSMVAEDHAGSQINFDLSQHQSLHQSLQESASAGNYEIHPISTPSKPAINNTQNSSEGSSNLCGSYDFDLSMVHLIESSSSTSAPQDPKDQLQNQLFEQFGLGNFSLLSDAAASTTQANTTSNIDPSLVPGSASQRQRSATALAAPNASFSAAKAIEIAQQAQRLYQVHQTSRFGQHTEVRIVESRSSRDESSGSSEDDSHAPTLKGTLAAVVEGKKLTDRALHIQKMREASAMGKVVAYNRLSNFQSHCNGNAINEDDEDEDTMPLGGLKQAAAKPAISGGSGANASIQQQHKYGAINALSNGQTVPGILPQDNMASSIARQHMAMPTQMQMQLPMQMQMHPQDSGQSAAHQGMYPAHLWQQRHISGLSSPNASTVSLHQHQHQQQQQQQHQQMQMGYSPRSPLVAGMHFSNNSGSARAVMSDNGASNMGSASITYGNIGLSRGAMPPDAIKHHAFTPSPLGQPPVTAAASAIAAASAMPTDMRMAQYPSAMLGQVSMPSLHGPVYSQKMPQQPQQQPQQQSQQQSMLATFIPSQAACRGSLAKNPLMRDINKIKEFSVKDYTARPTLLAEADSRRMAKKNMPGLGGTTCHSFQPEVQPQLTPASQQPYHAQTAQRGQHAPYHHSDRDRDRVEHHEHVRSSRKPDMSRRRTSPRMSNYDDDSYEDVSLSSGRSNRRYYGDSRGGSRNAKMQSHHGHRQRSSNPRRNHYDRAGSVYNSDYEDHPHGREFRKANPLSSLRNRRGIDRCRRDYHEDRHYDCYDYEEFSDDYFSDEFDEWSDDRYSERFGSSAGAAKGGLKRRTAQRRAQGDARASRDKDYDREARWRGPLRSNGKGGVHHGGRSRPAVPVVNLDDPRNNNDVLPRSAHRSRRGSISGDSDFSEKARNAKPRSQFGRMLANIKRQAAPGSPRAESESQNAAESKGSEKTDNLPKSESLKEEIDKENVNNSTGTEANANAEPEIHSAAATTPVTAPVAVA